MKVAVLLPNPVQNAYQVSTKLPSTTYQVAQCLDETYKARADIKTVVGYAHSDSKYFCVVGTADSQARQGEQARGYPLYIVSLSGGQEVNPQLPHESRGFYFDIDLLKIAVTQRIIDQNVFENVIADVRKTLGPTIN